MYAREPELHLITIYFFQSLFKITNLSLQHVNVYLGNSRKDRKESKTVCTFASTFRRELAASLFCTSSLCDNGAAWLPWQEKLNSQ